MNSSSRAEWFGWWSGLAGMLLLAVGFFAVDEGGTAPADAPITTLVDEIISKRGRIVWGSVIGITGALLFVWFAAALRARLAREGASVVGDVAYGFGLVAVVGALVHGTFRLALTAATSPETLAEGIRPLAIIGSHITDLHFFGLVGLTGAMSIAAWTVRLLPKPMAVVGLFLASATVALSPTDHGAAGVALQPWLGVACLFLMRRETSAAATQ